MNGYIGDIENLTEENKNFRKVLFTGKHCQLVVMSLKPGEDIGMEVHPDVDQFFRFEEGEAKVTIDGEKTMVKDGMAVIVPAGAEHNVENTSDNEDLKLYTIYSPPNHPDGTVHVDHAEAMKAEAEEHGH